MIQKILRGVPLFQDLDDGELASVEQLAQIKGYLANVPLFACGDPPDAFYVVSRGSVRIRIPSQGGREEKTVTLGPGQFFGEMGVMRGTPRMADAVVAEESVLVRIDRQAFDNLMAVEGEIAEKVMSAYMDRLAELKEAQRAAEKVSEAAAESARVLCFFSAGGGAGASFLVSNVALKLRDLSRGSTLVLDLDVQTPTQHLFLGSSGGEGGLPRLVESSDLTPAGVQRFARRLHTGIDLLGGPLLIPPGKATPALARELVAAARKAYDYVLVDTTSAFSPFNDALFSVCDLVHVVFGPDIVSVSRTLPLVRNLDEGGLGPRLRLVLNKFHPHEGFRPKTLEEKFGRPVLGRVEYEHSMALAAVNEGVPLVKRTPHSTTAVDLTRFARQTLSQPTGAEAARGGFSLWGLFG